MFFNKKLTLLNLIILLSINNIKAQNVELKSDFFLNNRQSLINVLPEKSVAVIFAGSVKNRANDVDYRYHQSPNFYYLTGFKESDAVLLVFKEEKEIEGVKAHAFLFVNEKQPRLEMRNGEIYGPQKTKNKLDIDAIKNKEFANVDFKKLGINKIFLDEYIVDQYEGIGSNTSLPELRSQFEKIVAKQKSNINKEFLKSFFASARQIKTNSEITLLQKAVDITAKGFDFMFKNFKANNTEYQAQAMVEYQFTYEGAQYTGYPSICGGANNATVLHYTTNTDTVKNNDLILVDAGAEYNGYTADITRTFPANGKFTTEQKQIYNLVLNAQLAGITACKIGESFNIADKVARSIIAEGLKELGIISNQLESRLYFMHGTSHYVGLDVHDPGDYQTLQAKQIITVEPGIYIPKGSNCDPKWWNIGVRIEDDILITENGPVTMSVKIPSKIEDLELLIQQSQNKKP